MYAVFHTGGKQYRVKKGDTLQVELLPAELGAQTNFSEVLLVGTGATVQVGTPFVASAAVLAEVVAIEKGPKIIVYHKKRRKQSDKKNGHRQPYTRLLITSIDNGAGEKDLLSADEKTQILGRTGFAQVDAWELPEDFGVDLEDDQAAPRAPKADKRAPKVKAAQKKSAAVTTAKKAAPKKKKAAASGKKKTKKS